MTRPLSTGRHSTNTNSEPAVLGASGASHWSTRPDLTIDTMDVPVQLYRAIDKDGKEHSFLQAQQTVPSLLVSSNGSTSTTGGDVFNILMADVSGSMSSYWPHVVQGWQEHVKDRLIGKKNKEREKEYF